MIGWSFALGHAVLVDEPAAQPAPELVDEFLETYISWREECASVHAAYERWLQCPDEDRVLTFASYQAALDREQKAATVHSASCAQLRGRRAR